MPQKAGKARKPDPGLGPESGPSVRTMASEHDIPNTGNRAVAKPPCQGLSSLSGGGIASTAYPLREVLQDALSALLGPIAQVSDGCKKYFNYFLTGGNFPFSNPVDTRKR